MEEFIKTHLELLKEEREAEIEEARYERNVFSCAHHTLPQLLVSDGGGQRSIEPNSQY